MSLLSAYDGKPVTYLAWAVDYWLDDEEKGRSLTLEQVQHVYAHKPLTAKMVKEINPMLTLAKLAADMTEIGYPRGKR